MKKPIPGLNMLAKFSGKHLKGATGPVDYARKQVDDLLVWFCNKPLIRRATARERIRFEAACNRLAQVCSDADNALVDNKVLEWRGQLYLRDRSNSHPKQKNWEDWMTERLGDLAWLVAGFEVSYLHCNTDEAIRDAFEIGKLADRIRAMRNDPVVGTGGPLAKGRLKGSARTKRKFAKQRAKLAAKYQPDIDRRVLLENESFPTALFYTAHQHKITTRTLRKYVKDPSRRKFERG